MPLASNFQNGLIYKLVCNDVDIPNVYAGSTCNFVKRKCGHKSDCNNENSNGYNYYVYQFIRANGGWSNWSMVKICDYPCNSKLELEAEERRHIEMLHADLNKCMPARTYIETAEYDQRYRNEHKEKMQQYSKEHHESNIDKIHERRNAKSDCECGGKYTNANKSAHMKLPKHCQYISNQAK